MLRRKASAPKSRWHEARIKRRNAAKNRALLAGGAAAVALGIGMLSKAARPK